MNRQDKILLVEDDRNLAEMVSAFLMESDFLVDVEGNGRLAISRILGGNYDLVLLDIGLPEVDGIAICRQVRSSYEGPIMMLTARGDEVDEVLSLEVGADDYIAKPVRPRALLARVRMHLNRRDTMDVPSSPHRLEVEGLRIDVGSRTVVIDDREVELTTAEFDLLWYLAENAGQVVARDRIYQHLLGMPYDGLDRSIDLRVSRLRKKIGDDPNRPQRIKSVRGVGYILAKEA